MTKQAEQGPNLQLVPRILLIKDSHPREDIQVVVDAKSAKPSLVSHSEVAERDESIGALKLSWNSSPCDV